MNEQERAAIDKMLDGFAAEEVYNWLMAEHFHRLADRLAGL